MGSKNKLKRFKENETFQNVFQPTREEVVSNNFQYKGKWNSDFFKNQNPIIIELGCGKGEYSVGLAEHNPDKNFIGIDIKGARFWRGAKTAVDQGMHNVAFVRTQIELVNHIFADGEVDEIWITFPDPQPQSTRKRSRLTNPLFLNRYKKILKKGGLIHLKTDSTSLYEYTLQVIEENKNLIIWQTDNLYQNCPDNRQELIQIKTHYEKLFTDKGENIKYICFKLS